MNKARRKDLTDVAKQVRDALAIAEPHLHTLKDALTDARERLEGLREEEQEAYEALPESIQNGDRGNAMQESIELMSECDGNLSNAEDTISSIDSTIDEILSAIESARDAQ